MIGSTSRSSRRERRWGRGVIGLFFLLLQPALAQVRVENPRSLSGRLSLGWFSTQAQDRQRQDSSNFFSTLRIDWRNYIVHPDFLTLRIRPLISSGFQNGLSGSSPGTGVDAQGVFLRKRPWPLSFRYSRNSRSLFSSGLGSSFTRVRSDADDSALGLRWQYLTPSLPDLDLEFTRVTNSIQTDQDLLRGLSSRSRTFSLRSHDLRGNWKLNGSVRWTSTRSQLPFARKTTGERTGEEPNNLSDRTSLSLRATRPLRESLQLQLSYDLNDYDTRFRESLISNAVSGLRARLDYRPSDRFRVFARFSLTRSRIRLEGLGRLDPSLARDQAPSSGQVSNRTANLELRYNLKPSFSIVERSELTWTSSQEGFSRAGNFANNSLGFSFQFARGSFSNTSSYFLTATSTSFSGSPPGRFLGHTADTRFSLNTPRTLQVSLGLSVFRNQENVRSLLSNSRQGERANLSLARRLWRSWLIRVDGDLQRSRFERTDQSSSFVSRSYGISFQSPILSLHARRSRGSGQGLFSFLDLSLTEPLPEGLDLVSLLETGNRSTTFGASLRLTRQIRLQANQRAFFQFAESGLSSRIRQQEARLTWAFREIVVETGYLLNQFDFGTPIFRKEWFFRIVRDFQVF